MLRLAHPEMAWGLLLVAVPLVIHLINRLRQRRVEWAAMEFLLESQRKHRTSVRLRELLLLLARMAAVAGIVLLLARPTWRPDWAAALGGSRSHQVVLIDDSFSMTDRAAATSTFDAAREALGRLADSLARQRRGAALTVARTSGLARDGRPWRADMTREPIDDSTSERLAELALTLQPSETAVAPVEAFEAGGALVAAEDSSTEIWLLTDCRQRNWIDAARINKALSALEAQRVAVHVVDCAERPRGNAAVTALDIPAGVRVAGIPLRVEVEVENFGEEELKNLLVEVAREGRWQPALTLERVAPRQKVRQAFHWVFDQPGAQTLSVRLPADAVAADNQRFAVVDVETESPALVIDDDPRSVSGRFLALALSPGGRTKTGLAPRVEPASFLTSQPLQGFSAIYLANFQRLDGPQRQALAKFLDDGGGLGVFLGPDTDLPAVTADLYAGGSGWFPLPLAEVQRLPHDDSQQQVDLQPSDPELFRIFAGQRNSFLQSVRINDYAAPPRGWNPSDRSTRVLAQLRDGQPLVVERRMGRGRVVAFLTTAAPIWNDWGRNPSFVVTLLELHARLASGRLPRADFLVGQPLEVALPASAPPTVRFLPPDAQAAPLEVATRPGPNGATATLPETDASGVYTATWNVTGGGAQTSGESKRLLAVNVEPREGDLARADFGELRKAFRQRAIDFAPADSWRLEADLAGWQSTQWMVLGLLGLLAGEQWLARRAGYHPLAREARR